MRGCAPRACWLAARPRVPTVDEPTRAVDAGAKAETHRPIDGLAHEGLGPMIPSEVPGLLSASDRIVAMRKGRLSARVMGACSIPDGVAAGVGAVLGPVDATIIAVLRVNPVQATLVTFSAFRGAVFLSRPAGGPAAC